MLEAPWIAYLPLSLGLFWFSAEAAKTLLIRAKFFFLSLAIMGFGLGRFLYTFEPGKLDEYSWLFTMSHWSLVMFGCLYIYAATYHRDTGEWP